MATKAGFRRSIAFKYTATFASVFAVQAVLFAVAIYWLSQSFLQQEIDNTIEADANGLVEYYESGGLELLTELLKTRLKRLSRDDVVYLLTDREYEPIMGNIPTWPAGMPKDGRWHELDRGAGYSYERDLRLLHLVLADGHHLIVARDTLVQDELEGRTLLILLIVLGVTLTTCALAGLYLHVNVRSRLRLISETCGEIAEGNLSHRIQLTGMRDEIDAMAQTLNETLDRNEMLMQGVRQVTNSIAHDLKTPLTRLRGRLETLTLAEQDTKKREEIGLGVAELDRLLSTFNALLRISRVEAGDSLSEFVEIDLAALIRDAVDFYEPIAEDRGQKLHLQNAESPREGLRLTGDRDLMFQSVANLIDNAIKYGACGQTVTVELRGDDEQVEILVRDQGEGIPEAERDRVFERFYRVEHSRTHPGNGLGLSLVAAVAKLHRGRVHLENDSGLRVRLTFPLG